MGTCFLFLEHADKQGCLSLKLSDKGALQAPMMQRSYSDIRRLQEESTTYVVGSSELASLMSLELPWLPERKARTAIPYALEDKLAQPVHELHFAFDKQHYQNNHYLITVLDKQKLQANLDLLAFEQIKFEIFTLDWFALKPGELCIKESTLLVYQEDFKGALTEELALNYLKKHPLNKLLHFEDSTLVTEIDTHTEELKQESSVYLWIAGRLLENKPLNICQGEMHKAQNTNWIQKGYQLAGVLCGIWLISLLIVNMWSLHILNKQTAKIDEHIAHIYYQFFPEAKQVISPKFRIEQVIKNNASDAQEHVWILLSQLAKVMKQQKGHIEQIRYQNNSLSVMLLSPDFASLEAIKNQLKLLGLKVTQTQASTRAQQVAATLELM